MNPVFRKVCLAAALTCVLASSKSAAETWTEATSTFLSGKGWFPSATFDGDAALNELIEQGYIERLQRLGEAPLSEQRGSGEHYRLVFGDHYDCYHLAIRVELTSSTAKVTRKAVCQYGGLTSQVAEFDSSAVHEFVQTLEAAGLWTCGDPTSNRGTTVFVMTPWLVEALRGDSYQLLEIRNTRSADWEAIRKAFLQLAGVSDFDGEVRKCQAESVPKLVEYVSPICPEHARAQHLSGHVVVQFVINSDGSVSEADVLREEPEGLGFAEAALAALTRWRYRGLTWSTRHVEKLTFNAETCRVKQGTE